LLSGSELLTVAEQDNNRKQTRARNLVFGILDIATVLLFFLPFFAQRINGTIYEVSLFGLTQIAVYLKVAYIAIVCALIVIGALILISRVKYKLSIFISALGIALFVAGLQPYPAVLLFVFLLIKVLMLVKW
jgi:hypothetical protein